MTFSSRLASHLWSRLPTYESAYALSAVKRFASTAFKEQIRLMVISLQAQQPEAI